jgi:hypothetical protein
MFGIFNRAAAPLSKTELTLQAWHIRYRKRRDGSIVVRGKVDFSNKGLTELPDLSEVEVRGHFYCNGNRLTSLKGAPEKFRRLGSDLGDFPSRAAIPEKLLTVPPAPGPGPAPVPSPAQRPAPRLAL